MAGLQTLINDATVRHSIDLVRYSNGAVRRIIALLNRVDADLADQLLKAMDRLPASAFTVSRLDDLLKDVRKLNAEAYQQVSGELNTELRDLADAELQYQGELFDSLGIEYTTRGVTANQVYAGAMARPFQGQLLREWMAGLEEGRARRVRDAVRMGYVEGQTTQQIVQRIRGTRARGYADGLLEIDRRHAEAVVRTAIGHTAGFARDRWYEANDDIIGALGWLSTLDGRTSPMCRLRDGLRYTPDTHKPIGHKVPWGAGPGRLHFCCRSTSVPILKGMEDEPLLGTRAAKGGPVKASTTYAEWLKGQPGSVQDDVLGKSKGALFRSGNLKLDQFYNDKGKTLTLDELKARFPKASERAGLSLPYQPPLGMPKDAIAKFLASPEAQAQLMERLYQGERMSYPAQLARVVTVKARQGYTSTNESLAAIRYYTGPGYLPINRRMRESGGTLEDRQFSALTVSGFPGIGEYKGEIWRAPTTRAANAEKWWERASIGQPFDMGHQLQSFSSSGEMSAGWAGNADVLLRIGRAKQGVYIDPLSLNPGEHEVLLPPGLAYRVVGKSTATFNDREYRVIDLEIDDER
ncbi:ADP-ribosyltransferase [Bordetella bronchiseptica]|uniref:ADP-ribosyltransferase n=1 Tax=Bordetella bronchiseptica TaxID=518 RepID=UPI003EDC2BC3